MYVQEVVVTVPVTGEVFETPEMLGRLAGFLRDLTDHLPPGEVFAAIVEQRELPDYDERLDSVLDDPQLFEAAWTAVMAGLPLPEVAWESVVLPAVVAFSTKAGLKLHLELAARFWVKTDASLIDARGADQVAGRIETEPEAEPEPEPRQLPRTARVARAIEAGPVAPPRPRARFAAWVLVALVLVAASGFVLWRVLSAPSGHPSVLDDSRTEVVASGGGTPTIAPSPSPDLAAPPVANTVPAPSPTWTGPGPATAPGAPTALAVIKITMTAIAFGWQPPGNAGTGGIAYYRITLNGADAGWTTDTKVTLGGLNPATTYTIAVRAVNNAGLTSPASGSLTATTSPMPTASSTTVAVPTFSVSPANPIPLGDSFGVTGSGWTCIAPDQIEVLFDGERVATRVADVQGGFTATVNVHADQDGTFYANVLGSGNTRVKITSGDHMLTVQCAAMSKTTTVTFT